MAMQTVVFKDLGTMSYRQAWDYQERLLQQNLRAKSLMTGVAAPLVADDPPPGWPDPQQALAGTTHYLLMVEHPPVYTLGKSGHPEHILIDEKTMEARGIEFFRTNRGGDITFHGPGQIVAYPVMDLEKFYTDIGKYLRNLEEVIIRVMADYGLQGERSPGQTGVWLDARLPGKERKICAMGVRCSRWITMHGLAFNVNTDLSYFNDIIPCGIRNKQVSSLELETGRKWDMEDVKNRIKNQFEVVFDCSLSTARI